MYIPVEKRIKLLKSTYVPEGPDELAFLFTVVIRGYLETRGPNFKNACDILGALEATKAELCRRVFAGLNNNAAQREGDIYVGNIFAGTEEDGESAEEEPGVQGASEDGPTSTERAEDDSSEEGPVVDLNRGDSV